MGSISDDEALRRHAGVVPVIARSHWVFCSSEDEAREMDGRER